MITLTEHGTPALDTVHHCRAEALLSAMDTGSVDLIVTSPPYDNLRSYQGFAWNFEYIAQQAYRVLKQGGVMVWVVGDATVDGSETLSSFKQAIHFKECAGFNLWDTMIYQKSGCRPQRPQLRYDQSFEYMFVLTKGEPKAKNFVVEATIKQQASRSTKRQRNGTMHTKIYTPRETHVLSNVWLFNTGNNSVTTDREAYEHPAMFPEALAERHILTWSNPGDVVLDFFGGSGTTAKMARANGRRYVTCDISKVYCDLMQKRLDMPFTLPMLLETA